jgi:hypothetical protein
MIKSFILTLTFCLIVISAFTQHILFDWQNCIKGGKWETTQTSLCLADDGYFITAMQERGTHVDIVLIKTSLTGDSLWRKYYGGSDAEWPCGVFPTLDGNYYLVGTECSEDGDITVNPYPNSCNIWIMKIDSAGNKLWDKIYGGSSTDEAMNAIVTFDGGLAILNSTFSYDGDVTNYYGYRDIWILKLDANGNKQWDFTIGTPGFDYAYGITQTQDSGFILSGGFMEGSMGNIQCYNADSSYVDGLLFQIDKHGEPVNKKCYHGSKHDLILQVIELPNGYLIAGSTESPDIVSTNIGFHPGITYNGNPTSDIWLQKTDFDWNIEWQRCYGGWGDDNINQLYQCSNGDYMMFGTTTSSSGDVSGIHGYVPGYDSENDIWMVRINSLGDIIWQRCIGTYGRQEITTNSVLKITDADYVIASTTNAGGYADGDIACTSNPIPSTLIPFVWLFQITDTAASVGINQPPLNIEAKLYPNPAHEYATVEIPVTYTLQNANAEIIDASGRIISRFKVKEKKFVLNVTGYSKGIYLLRVSDAKGVVTKRFIVG